MNLTPPHTIVDLRRVIVERLEHYRKLRRRGDLSPNTRAEVSAAIDELTWVQAQLGPDPETTEPKPEQLSLV